MQDACCSSNSPSGSPPCPEGEACARVAEGSRRSQCAVWTELKGLQKPDLLEAIAIKLEAIARLEACQTVKDEGETVRAWK